MNKKILFYAIIICGLFSGFSACSSTKKEVKSGDEQAIDTMRLQFNIANVDTMSVIFPESNDVFVINEKDKTELGKLIALSINDTLWNNSGIMVKMVAPDYTIVSHYKGQSADNNSWLMIWKENGRAKFENKWYFLDEAKKSSIYQILDAYK